jgi:hypothetical protein
MVFKKSSPFSAMILSGLFGFGLMVSLLGCKADTNTFATPNASVGGTGSGGAVDSTTGFKISITPKAGVTGFTHAFASTSTACEIPISSKDIATLNRYTLPNEEIIDLSKTLDNTEEEMYQTYISLQRKYAIGLIGVPRRDAWKMSIIQATITFFVIISFSPSEQFLKEFF